MTIGEQLLNNFPNTIKKDDVIFESLVANPKKNGAIESVLKDADDFCKEYSLNKDIYNQSGTLLEQTMKFFSYIEKSTSETDDSVKNRISSIFKRNGDKIWGTPNNIKNVFKQYFPSANIYVCENCFPFAQNLIKNGSIQTLSMWDYSDESILSKDARFVNDFGVELKSPSDYLEQTITLNIADKNYKVKNGDTYKKIALNQYGNDSFASYISSYGNNPEILEENMTVVIPVRNSYFLHFFSKDKCNVILTDTNGKYWNNDTKEWVNEEYKNLFESDDWMPQNMWFITDITQPEIKVRFEGVDGGSVDYIRLFNKYPYSTYCVIIHFATSSDEEALAVADGNRDEGPIINNPDGSTEPPKYGNYGYYDGIYLTGSNNGFAQNLYEDLLDYIHSSGVKSFLELISRSEQ